MSVQLGKGNHHDAEHRDDWYRAEWVTVQDVPVDGEEVELDPRKEEKPEEIEGPFLQGLIGQDQPERNEDDVEQRFPRSLKNQSVAEVHFFSRMIECRYYSYTSLRLKKTGWIWNPISVLIMVLRGADKTTHNVLRATCSILLYILYLLLI